MISILQMKTPEHMWRWKSNLVAGLVCVLRGCHTTPYMEQRKNRTKWSVNVSARPTWNQVKPRIIESSQGKPRRVLQIGKRRLKGKKKLTPKNIYSTGVMAGCMGKNSGASSTPAELPFVIYSTGSTEAEVSDLSTPQILEGSVGIFWFMTFQERLQTQWTLLCIAWTILCLPSRAHSLEANLTVFSRIHVPLTPTSITSYKLPSPTWRGSCQPVYLHLSTF